MKRRSVELAAAALCGLLCVTPAAAGDMVIAGPGGTTDPPNPTGGASTEEDWNPVVTCTVPPGGTIEDLLACLEDEIATPPPCPPQSEWELVTVGHGANKITYSIPPPGCSYPQDRHDFIVDPLPPPEYGVTIHRLDGSEINRMALRENDPGIQTTALRNSNPDRVARIRLIEQAAQGGNVYITINDVVISLITGPNVTILQQNSSLIQQIQNGGLLATYVGPYLYIRDRRAGVWGVHNLEWRSTDPGIILSDLGLYPEGDPVVPPPGPVIYP